MERIKRAIILAAGEGKRLRPVTLTTPKPLIKVKGRSFIHRIIDDLKKNDIHEIYIVTGYKKECFYEAFKDDPEIKRLKAERRAEREAEGRQSLLSKGAAILREYFSILKLRSMRYLLLVSMLYLIANTIFSSDRVFFMTYNLGMSQKTISAIMLLITLSGIAFVPFIERLSRRLDKKNVFMLGIGLAGVLLILMRFVPTVGLKSVIAVSLFYSVANTCYWQLMPSMIYDIAEIDEIVTGESHAGSVISFQALSESVCIAIGLQALGIILSLSGFDETQPSPMEAGGVIMQPESALTWVSHSFTLIPGIFMVLVFLVMLKYPVTQEKLKKLREEKMLK